MLQTNRLLLLFAATLVVAACTGADQPISLTNATPPAAPTGLSGTPIGSTGASLSWNAPSGSIGVAGYVVSRNGAQVATTTTTSYTDSGLAAATTYSYSVAALDAAGNMSPNSRSVNVTTAIVGPPPPGTPSQPTGLTAVATSATTVNLSWNASTDSVGVTGYIVSRNGVQIGTPTATAFADGGLTGSTTYTYTVVARNAAGNKSSAATIQVSTPAPPPPQMNGTAGLAWDPVTAPNLSEYRVYYGTAPRTYAQPSGRGISAGGATTFLVTGLTSGIRYYFVVTATDTQGNESAYSNEVFKDIP